MEIAVASIAHEFSKEKEMVISLVIIMTISGQDFERKIPQSSLELCWENAQNNMKSLNKEHGDKLESIGVGCVIDREGKPI